MGQDWTIYAQMLDLARHIYDEGYVHFAKELGVGRFEAGSGPDDQIKPNN